MKAKVAFCVVPLIFSGLTLHIRQQHMLLRLVLLPEKIGEDYKEIGGVSPLSQRRLDGFLLAPTDAEHLILPTYFFPESRE